MVDIFNANNMFITSDPHFFHANIIKYCDRNYNWEDNYDVLKMNEDILEKFDALPDTKDTVIWNLGDFAFGRLITTDDCAFGRLRDIVSRMKGKNRTLCYVIGNHDKDLFKFLKKHISVDNVVDMFRALGFDFVYNCPIMFTEDIILSHEPVFLKPGSGKVNIHGHTHNINVDEKYFKIDIENYLMKYKAAVKDNMENIPEPIMNWPYKEINVKDYINICLDANNMEILDFKKLLKDLKSKDGVK